MFSVHLALESVVLSSQTTWQKRWRQFWFCVLLCLSVASGIGSIWSIWLWRDTVAACIRIYFHKSDQSLLFNAAKGTIDAWNWLITLDISSASALVLMLLTARMAWSGLKNTIWLYFQCRKDKVDFWSRAFTHPNFTLIPAWLRSIFIQLGLLGTLASFILAANLHMQRLNEAAKVHTATTTHEQIRRVVEGPAPKPTAQDASGKKSEDNLSDAIFVLLCASLFSSLVGCFVAYLIVPPLNLLNNVALGVGQVPDDDEDILVENFKTGLRDATEACQSFKETVTAMTDSAKGLDSLSNSVDSLQRSLIQANQNVTDLGKDCRQAAMDFNAAMQMISSTGDAMSELGQSMTPIAKEFQNFFPSFLQVLVMWRTTAQLSAKNLQDAGEQALVTARCSQDSARQLVESTGLVLCNQAHTIELLNTLQQSVGIRHENQDARDRQMEKQWQSVQTQLKQLEKTSIELENKMEELQRKLKLQKLPQTSNKRFFDFLWRPKKSPTPVTHESNGRLPRK